MGAGLFEVLTGNGTFVMRYSPFRGVRKAAWYPPGVCAGAGWATAGRLYRETDVKKVKVTAPGATRHLAALENEMFKEHMAVLEVLAMLQYDDGTPRSPGYLGMWTQGATWFVRVQDKDADAQMTAEGRTAEEAWDNLTLLLGSDNPPWEPMSRRKKKAG